MTLDQAASTEYHDNTLHMSLCWLVHAICRQRVGPTMGCNGGQAWLATYSHLLGDATQRRGSSQRRIWWRVVSQTVLDSQDLNTSNRY